jgi:DNA-binding CsgD family transcriptional regulator
LLPTLSSPPATTSGSVDRYRHNVLAFTFITDHPPNGKSDSPFRDDELLSAVAQALARSTEDWRQRGELAESRARLGTLTPREFEVFRLVIVGLLNKEIGAELGITLRTTKSIARRLSARLSSVTWLYTVTRENGSSIF